MAYGSFNECHNGMVSANCGAISYLTWFVNEKCKGKLNVIHPCKTISSDVIKSVDYIYTDSDNDLMVHYTDGEAELLVDKSDVILSIIRFYADIEKMFWH